MSHPFSDEYVEQLLSRVPREMRAAPFGHQDATVVLIEEDGEPMVRMQSGGQRLTWGLTWGLYAYEPDGSDVQEHAELLALQFDEDSGPDG